MPSHCGDVFFLFHSLGPIKASEQLCESAASGLNFLSDRRAAATDSSAAKSMLRSYQLSGDGQDDLFILRVWAEMSGSSKLEGLRFNVKHRKAREKSPLGRGSKTLRLLTFAA